MNYTPETFDPTKYEQHGWRPQLYRTSSGEVRFIVHVATGRKWWVLSSVVPNFSLGLDDPALVEINAAMPYYTFPTFDRFRAELETVLTDLYGRKVHLHR